MSPRASTAGGRADATLSGRRVAAACPSWRTCERGGSRMSAAATDALAALPGYADLGPGDLILSHFSLVSLGEFGG